MEKFLSTVSRLAWPGVILVYFIALPSVSAQSGWTKGKGELFAKLSLGGFSSDQYVNLSGDPLTTAAFRQVALTGYAEYGLNSRLTLQANWPVLKAQGFSTTETIFGWGDLMIGAKYSLLKGKFPISISVLPEIPIGPANQLAQNRMLSFETINLPTGDGEWNVHSILAVSHSFYPAPVYANAFVGFNYRSGFDGVDFQNQGRAGSEVGVNFLQHFWGRATLSVQQSLGPQPQTIDFVRGEGTAYTLWGLGLMYKWNENWGIDLSYQAFSDWLVPRTNLYQAGAISVGLVFERKGK